MAKRQEITDRDRRIKKILTILHQVEAMPRDWSKGDDAWKKYVAAKHKVARQSIYRWLASYAKRGIVGLEHHKSNRGQPKVWTKEALDFWFGLCLLPQKREITLADLYQELIHEAQLRSWHVGCRRSAILWVREKAQSLIGN